MIYISKWKVALILGVCLVGLIFAIPNLYSRATAEGFPDWLPHRQINLGLDLRGGSHLLLEVDGASITKEKLDNLSDAVREELRRGGVAADQVSLSQGAVRIALANPAEASRARDVVIGIEPDAVVEVGREGELLVAFPNAVIARRVSAAVDQAIEIVRRRIDETGVREPLIQRQGAERILIQLPGLEDPGRIRALIGTTAKMTFHLVDESAETQGLTGGRAPAGSMLLPYVDRTMGTTSGQTIVVRRRVLVSGENLVDANPSTHQNQWQVAFRFDSIGAKRFGEATSQNVGKRLAIVLDNKVISAPTINEPILGGSGVITGNFTVAEAQDLALLLRAGALPAPLTVLEERTVGPGLGTDSIAAGTLASIIGIAVVAVFMVIVYGLFGFFAIMALAVNLIMIIGILSLFQATLTLPGIAGIVLTVGVAVDANVLIFERIREEIRAGQTAIASTESGFRLALSSIIDANMTTLISTVILYIVGTGPVRGFAVTLTVGTITSMFTAIYLTRLFVVIWLRKAKPKMLAV